MHKRILAFTNMSEASKGISVSHIQRGDLSLDFVWMFRSKTETQSFNTPKALSFKKAFFIFLCTRDLFFKYIVQIADLQVQPLTKRLSAS